VGDIIRLSEKVMLSVLPDALLVLGDTNSSLAAYMAKRLHIPVFHMEAGNRSYDFNVPEEINRRIIDHIADFNLVYTEHARRQLLSEGLPHRRIYLTGSPMKEVIEFYMPAIKKSTILEQLHLERGRYFVVSFHREENVDDPENLHRIIQALKGIYGEYHYPLVITTHPRTRKRLEEDLPVLNGVNFRFNKPFCFTDYVFLQMNSACTISDSGTLCEESAILGFPAVSIRQSLERPEAQDAGTVILTGFDPDVLRESVSLTIKEFQQDRSPEVPFEYQIKDTSWRVLKLIMGNAALSNKWHGISRSPVTTTKSPRPVPFIDNEKKRPL